jgi:hypothetical protein
MKLLFSLLLGCALLTTEAAVAAHHPKGMARRASAHTKEAQKLNPSMHFRRSPRPAPLLDLHAHSPEKFKTVRTASSYKFK